MSFLSDTKKNLIRSLDVKAGDRVLLPGKTAEELSLALQEAGALVFTELPEKIASGNTSSGGNGRNDSLFDLIFLAGSLKALTKETGLAEADLLQALFSLLRPQGRLAAACDNAVGIGYLAGQQLEEDGGFFGGLVPPADGTQSVYFYQEFCGFFSSLDGAETAMYYPYPGYRYPLTVFSDDRLPQPGELSHLDVNFDRPRLWTFSDSAAFDTVIEKGLFPEFANSFFAVAVKGNLPEQRVIYRRFPDTRNRAFRMETDILSGPSGKAARKVPVFSDGLQHIEHTFRLTEELSAQLSSLPHTSVCLPERKDGALYYPFVSGRSLRELISESAEKRDFDRMDALLDRFRELVFFGSRAVDFAGDRRYREVFGDACLYGSAHVAPVTNLDPIFENILVDDEEWILLDCEWTVDFPVPLKYVLYRALKYYTEKDLSPELYDHIRERFHITDEEETVFSAMEAALQAYICGGQPSFREEAVEKRKQIVFIDKVFSESLWNIYYDRGEGYSEQSRLLYPVPAAGKAVLHIEFSSEVKSVRIDPGERKGLFRFRNMDALPEGITLSSNGTAGPDGLFAFAADDPWIELKNSGFTGSFDAEFDMDRDGGTAAAVARMLAPETADRTASEAEKKERKKHFFGRRQRG